MQQIDRPSLNEVREVLTILRRRVKRRRILFNVLTVLLVVGMLAAAALMTVARVFTVADATMADSLTQGDVVLVNMVGCHPSAGDLVAARDDTGHVIIRRVLGAVGEREDVPAGSVLLGADSGETTMLDAAQVIGQVWLRVWPAPGVIGQ